MTLAERILLIAGARPHRGRHPHCGLAGDLAVERLMTERQQVHARAGDRAWGRQDSVARARNSVCRLTHLVFRSRASTARSTSLARWSASLARLPHDGHRRAGCVGEVRPSRKPRVRARPRSGGAAE